MNPSVTITSTAPAIRSPPSTLPAKLQRQRAALRLGGEQFVRPAGQRVPLARLGADGEQADLRRRDAERDLRVGDAELAELHEHLRLGVGGGARVDEHRRLGVGRQHDGQPRAAARRAAASSRCRALATIAPVDPAETTARGLPAPDQLAGDGDAGPGPPEPGERALAHPDHVLGGHHPQLRARRRAWR